MVPGRGSPLPFSIAEIVLLSTPAAAASCACVTPSSARAARKSSGSSFVRGVPHPLEFGAHALAYITRFRLFTRLLYLSHVLAVPVESRLLELYLRTHKPVRYAARDREPVGDVLQLLRL